jgi:hypothetical protein
VYDVVHSGKEAEAAVDVIIRSGKGAIFKAIVPLPGSHDSP